MNALDNAENSNTIEFVSMKIGGQFYCVEITSVLEIRRWSTVTPLPNSEDYVLGVMNLRGAVIPIIDMSRRLGRDGTEICPRSVVIIAITSSRTVGFLVDAVSEIMAVSPDQVRKNPSLEEEGDTGEVSGLVSVNSELLKVLDLDAVMSFDLRAVA